MLFSDFGLMPEVETVLVGVLILVVMDAVL